ncbi:helix-turn-helix transcriptional regulator [Ancylobacter sp. IITR112]|uniref:helix-turn-helix transcriptional regulator n=1 Tax=Ancylobacter sp. IITR112 TaxID=3138073 RepID=UPI00352A24EE
MLDAEEYAEVAGAIYEAAAIPEMWSAAIGQLSRLGGCFGGSIFSHNESGTNWVASEPIAPLVQQFLRDGWMERNDRLAGLLGRPHAGFLTDLDVFTLSQIEAMPVYRDALRPAGFGWGAATIVRSPTGDAIVVSLERRWNDGPVAPQEVRVLDSLRPHLARAALLGARLGLQRMQGMLDALAGIGLPGAVVTPQGRLVGSNADFDRLGGQITTRLRERLVLTDEHANRLLQVALQDLASDRPGQVGSLPVPASGEGAPCLIHVIPIRRQAHDIFGQAGALLVVARAARPDVPEGLLSGLYDLTPSEAAVAARLIEGLTIAGIASHHGSAVETVRSHVKKILQKTGFASQVDLVRTLAPIMSLRPHPGEG